MKIFKDKQTLQEELQLDEERARKIAVEIRDKIFDYDVTSDSSRGTGLGLPVVKRYCESTGGYIEYAALPGFGSEFSAYFGSA